MLCSGGSMLLSNIRSLVRWFGSTRSSRSQNPKCHRLSFIYDLVKGRYSLDSGRPAFTPSSSSKCCSSSTCLESRQTIKEIETNIAYRWFLGYDFTQPMPHFTTFGKNYVRRFQGPIYLKRFLPVFSRRLAITDL